MLNEPLTVELEPELDADSADDWGGFADEAFVAPASFAQQRLWLIDRLEPGLATYNVPLAARLAGSLDPEALANALGELVARHEALRTSFAEEGGEPVQIIVPEISLALPAVDLRALPAARREAEALEQMQRDAERPFDLSQPPLLRAALFQLGSQEHLLALNQHHIVTDAWSLDVLIRELLEVYEALVQGRPVSLPELPIQYADFATWQREWLQGETLTMRLLPLRRRLEGAPATLNLPTDRPRTSEVRPQGGVLHFSLSADLAAALQERSREAGVTMFMTLLAAFQALLGRVSGQDDVVVGSPVANRNRLETENVLGFFANTLALRARMAGDPEFREHLARIREVTVEAYAHEDLPFEKLVEELRPERRLDQTPLFQVLFSFQQRPGATGGARSAGIVLTPVGVHSGTAKFDLTLNAVDAEDGLSGFWEYSAALFDAATIDRFSGHLRTLLEDAVAHPSRRLSELALLTPEETAQLAAWNPPVPAFPALCLHERFEQQAERTPLAVAVTGEGLALTYRELDERASRLAAHLQKLGVGPETLVGLCAERSPDLVAGALGILKAGGAYLPLDPAYPQERLAFMIEDSRIPVLVTQGHLADKLPSSSARTVALEPAISEEAAAGVPSRVTPANLAYVIYTSGSTGTPKGVQVTHANVSRLLTATEPWFDFGDRDAWTLFHSYAFDFSVWEMWGALLHGGRLVVVPYWVSRSPEAFAELLRRERVTVLNQTPSAFGLLSQALLQEYAEEDTALDALRLVIFGGEALAPRRLGAWFERFGDRQPRLVNMYGITETTVHVTYRPLAAGDAALAGSPIGVPIPDLAVHALDPHRQAVPVGVPGEIYVGGAGLARGYLGRPDLTAERFVPDPFGEPGSRLYRTGDLARRLADGSLEFLGRVDQQVKIRGFRIEPGEVEAALAAHPGLRECAVVARPGANGDPVLVAYFAGRAQPAPGFRQLRDFLAGKLPDHMVPAAFVELPALPRTASGKVDRGALPEPRSDAGAGAGFVPPRTPIEEVLAGIWSEALRKEPIGAHDSFFDLGGHSLTATGVVSQIRAIFQVELAPRAVFESPTLSGLAGRIERLLMSEGGVELPPITPMPRAAGGEAPLSFAQQRLWFLDELAGNASPFYNIFAALSLEGELDVESLSTAVGEIVRRHEALRTTFRVGAEGQPVQVVHPAKPIRSFRLPVADLTGLPDPEAEAVRLSRQEERLPFSLARGPLLRLGLLRLAEERHALLLSMHHIVSDGWSLDLFVRELAALYAAHSSGLSSPLPELPVQYADFAQWQRRWLEGKALDTQLAFWKQQLTGAPTVLELPADRPRPAVQSHVGATVRIDLHEALANDLKALAREHRGTLFMTLLAAFSTLLQRYTGQDDVLVGSPIANRNRAETESLIGFFVNLLVLRTDLTGEPTFRQLFDRVRETALGSYAHQDLPFERLVEELQPQRDLSRNPLFQVSFTLASTPWHALQLPGLRLGFLPHVSETGTELFDLTLRMFETPEGFNARIGYNVELFDRATVHRLGQHFEALLAAIAADPGRPAATVPLLTGAERHQLTAEWSGVLALRQPAAGETFAARFEAQAEERPQAVALAWRHSEVTYEELNRRANRLAHHLRGLGIGPEDVVALCVDNAADFVTGLVAVLKAGGAHLPLDPDLPRERLDWMLADSGAKALVTRGSLAGAPQPEGIPAVRLDADAAAIGSRSPENPDHRTLPGNLAYVIYTSGSTGRPKAVQIPHEALAAHASEYIERISLGPEDRMLQLASFSFDLSLDQVLPPLLAGAAIVPWESEVPDAAELARFLVEQKVTIAHLTTALWHQAARQWAESRPESLQGVRLRLMQVGGEALPADALALWRRTPLAEVPLADSYGPTETTVVATFYGVPAGQGDPRDAAGLSIGRPLTAHTVHLLDRYGEPVPVGAVGEIHLGGPALARGYLGRPERTAAAFVPDPFASEAGARLYRTGDLARFRPDGHLEFAGRRDHQMKLRGFRLEPGEIEAALLAHPQVRSAAVVLRDGPDGPESRRLVAYVSGDPGNPGKIPSDSELRTFLRERLPAYMVPAVYVPLDALPRTPSGKLDRAALPAPTAAAARQAQERSETAERPAAAPAALADSLPKPAADPLEALVIDLWKELLGVAEVRPDDNFFDLGGHSLLLAVMRGRLQQELGLEVPILELFNHVTVRALADFLRGEVGDLLPPAATSATSAAIAMEEPAAAAPAVVPRAATQDPLEALVTDLWRELLGVEEIRLDDNFFDLGGHSLLLAVMRGRLQQELGAEVPILDLFNHTTVRTLADYLRGELGDLLPAAAPGAPTLTAAEAAAPQPAAATAPAAAVQTRDIAIVGIAAHLPGARDADEYWANLRGGVESITFFLEGGREAWQPPAEPLFRVPAKGVVDGAETWDAAFFGFSRREAETMDPQHRLFLDSAWEALERAGYDSEQYRGKIGVFGGTSKRDYLFLLALSGALSEPNSTALALLGTETDTLAPRTAYKLGLEGPSVNVQNGCATSALAVHLACASLLDGECDMALAGAASISAQQRTGYVYHEGGLVSREAICRSFDARGDGEIDSDGVGVVVLKRLADALADGDHIHAVIKGSAVRNDGADRAGLQVPRLASRAQVVRDAIEKAGVPADSIGFIEACGVATIMGDSMEVTALASALAGLPPGSCALGSVTPNIGGTNGTSGLASLIKTALALEHRQIPPTLHFEELNPEIDLRKTPFYINTDLREWRAGSEPRRAGVNSFGVGGVSVHMVLEEPPARPAPASEASRPWQLLTLSAKTPAALDAATEKLAGFLERQPGLPPAALADIAWTLQIGRRAFEHRRTVLCRSVDDAVRALRTLDPAAVGTGAVRRRNPPVAFLLAAEAGADAVSGAGRPYAEETVFREEVERCASFLRPQLAKRLRDALFTGGAPIDDPDLAELALFTLEYALGRLWISWGLAPQTVAGEGVGEYAAACLTGVAQLEETLSLLAARGVQPGRFTEALGSSAEAPDRLVLVIGSPGAADAANIANIANIADIAGSAAQRLRDNAGAVLAALPAPGEPPSAIPYPLEILAQAWRQGAKVDWRGVHAGEERRRLPLPTYPFERQRYWVKPSVNRDPLLELLAEATNTVTIDD